jgi:acetyltransferase-like isoleucine patch superfamily enzyme
MLTRIRYFTSRCISIVPFSKCRVFLYNLIFKYEIKNSIGYGTIIDVKEAVITNCTIGKFNKFFGPMKVEIKEKSKIGDYNIFNCGAWTENKSEFKKTLKIGKKTLITGKHYFDVSGLLSILDETWIAGNGSQFWTHGSGTKKRYIIIGKNCYISSAVRFAPGVNLANNILVGIGSVVTKDFINDNMLIAGVPAKVIKKKYDWKTQEYIT